MNIKFKKRTFILFLSAVLLLLTANSTVLTASEKSNSSSFASKSSSVAEILENPDKYVNKKVEIEGMCTHICRHGGKKIFLKGGDKQIIRIQASDKIGSFDKKCVKSNVKVKGTLVETRIDEAYLKNWEAELKSAEEAEHESCGHEQAARGEKSNTTAGRIADFRKQIAEREAKTGKAYLSFYHIDAVEYKIK